MVRQVPAKDSGKLLLVVWVQATCGLLTLHCRGSPTGGMLASCGCCGPEIQTGLHKPVVKATRSALVPACLQTNFRNPDQIRSHEVCWFCARHSSVSRFLTMRQQSCYSRHCKQTPVSSCLALVPCADRQPGRPLL